MEIHVPFGEQIEHIDFWFKFQPYNAFFCSAVEKQVAIDDFGLCRVQKVE